MASRDAKSALHTRRSSRFAVGAIAGSAMGCLSCRFIEFESPDVG